MKKLVLWLLAAVLLILPFGGCNANNMQYMGDVLKSHHLSCELEKKRLECAIMIKAALA